MTGQSQDTDRNLRALRGQPDAEALAAGVLAGERALLARAITLVESQNRAHRAKAQDVLDRVRHAAGNAIRIGITGVPGVGKSTTIDQFGTNLTEAGHRIAVLAVDPTSQRSGGSILGDKTRMSKLSIDRSAFIRPSPTSGTLGGVARRTRETMTLVEAAGFDIVLVETVGVGQSETTVADMVDIFVVLLLPGGGDDLQGIKKGVIELADLVAINKADGDNKRRAERTAGDYRSALTLLTPVEADWRPPVLTMSGLENEGLTQLWHEIDKHQTLMQKTGARARRRARQALSWMDDLLGDEMWQRLVHSERAKPLYENLRDQVRRGDIAPGRAVDRLLEKLGLSD